MKAIFEVKFKAQDMIDRKTLRDDYNNDWNKLMKYLYEEEGFGLFNEKLKLIKVIK